MGVNLRKEAKVRLSKGQNVNLTKTTEKSGDPIRYAFVGANWSCMKNGRSVDLDSSILVYDENKILIDTIYFGNTESRDGAIIHSGDDRSGDTNGGDIYDNEVIRIDFKYIDPRAKYMVSILNNYTHQNFNEIPNIELRIYTNESGMSHDIDSVLASYKVDNNPEYEGKEALVLGHFYKHNGLWKFSADGDSSTEKSIDAISKGSALKVLD